MAGEWAVVTGAAGGIGAVIARLAVRDGYRVAAWDTDPDALARTVSDLGPDHVTARVVDVTDEESVRAAAADLPAPPALVVNAAGIVRFGPLLDLPVADWRVVVDVNLTGTFVVARTLARFMIDAGGGAVVNLASVNGGSAAGVGAGGYTASKAGVVRLTEQMALEWARYGLRVNAVAPGLIDAGMSHAVHLDPEVRRQRSERVPLGRIGAAEDVAEAVLFLGSATYVTGQTVVVDGGISLTSLSGLPRSGPGRSA